MPCVICGRTKEEADLYEGIYIGEITTICGNCAEDEKVPLIKKPTQEQLLVADHRHSVKERIEQLSPRRTLSMSKDQEIANKNLAKLNLPPKKQQPESLVDNYHWKIQNARRKQKITINQLSKQTGISHEILENLEKAQPPENLESVILVLEEFLDIKLFKETKKRMIFHIPEKTPEQKEKLILEKTRENLEKTEKKDKEKQKVIKEISSGKFDFSKHEKIQNLTLNDLIEMKRKKEQKQAFEKEKKQHQEMFGDEVELED